MCEFAMITFFMGWYPNIGEYNTIEHIDCVNAQYFINVETGQRTEIIDSIVKGEEIIYIMKDIKQ